MWSVEKEDAEYEYFLDYVKAVVNVNESYSKFNRFANDKRLEYISMMTIAKEVHPIINSVISSFDTNAEFTMNEIITEKGICYSVNSILSPLISTVYVAAKERNFLFFISFVVYSTMNQKKLSMQSKPLSCFFVKNQCYMKLDVYDPTVFVKSRLTRLKFS